MELKNLLVLYKWDFIFHQESLPISPTFLPRSPTILLSVSTGMTACVVL